MDDDRQCVLGGTIQLNHGNIKSTPGIRNLCDAMSDKLLIFCYDNL